MTSTTSQREPVRFLEDRFTCAACTGCVRACAVRAGPVDPDGTGEQAPPRRRGILCAEVCDATCRMLSEQGRTGEAAPRLRPEWTRTVCLESARVVERHPGAEKTARAGHDCARACSAFMTVLD